MESLGSGGGSPLCVFQNSGGFVGDTPDHTVVAAIDATIQKVVPTTNDGDDTACDVKGGSRERSCLIKFDLASIPSNSTVTKACLEITVVDSSVVPFSPRRLLRPWKESETTWSVAETAVAWGKAGAKGTTDRAPADLAVIPPNASGTIRVSFDVAVLQSWISVPSTNYGMTIAESATSDGITFSSSEGPAALAPRLLFE